MRNDAFASLLAQVIWETGRAIKPVIERGSIAYLTSRPYYPWIGNGLIQPTWEANYKKFGITKWVDAGTWENSLRICFEGMVKGMFTGKKLDDYFNAAKTDFFNARRIVNGLDQAHIIEVMSLAIYAGLQSSSLS